jgi:hypothetical protein
MPEVVIALVALAATVFFGVMALPERAAKSDSAGPSNTQLPTSTAQSRPARPTPSQKKASRDVVRIVGMRNRPGVVDVTVRVDGPPSPATEYLLVAHFRGEFQLKGKVSASIGSHTVEADVRLADPGSWRDFFVIGADSVAVSAWEDSKARPILEIPDRSKPLTQWIPHQMPA